MSASAEGRGFDLPPPAVLVMPMAKFAMGTAAYILSVLLISWVELQFAGNFRYVALLIGVMSCSTVVTTVYMIQVHAISLHLPWAYPFAIDGLHMHDQVVYFLSGYFPLPTSSSCTHLLLTLPID